MVMADTRDKSGPNSTQPMRQIDHANHVNSFTALQASEMTSNHQEHDHLDSGTDRFQNTRLVGLLSPTLMT